MANFNKSLILGRLTRDVECRTFSTDGKVAKFGIAVNGYKKDSPPMFIEVEAFNRGSHKLADLCESYLHKGSNVFIEGHLVFEQWKAQDGSNRSKHKVVVDQLQLLDSKPQSSDMGPVDNGPDAPF